MDLLEQFKKRFASCLDRPLIRILLIGFERAPESFWLERSDDGNLLVCYYLRAYHELAYEYSYDPYSLERDAKRPSQCTFVLVQSTHGKKGSPKKWAIVPKTPEPPRIKKTTVSSTKPSKPRKKRSRPSKKVESDDDYEESSGFDYMKRRSLTKSVEAFQWSDDLFAHLNSEDFAEIEELQLNLGLVDDIEIFRLQARAPPLPEDW